MIEQIIELARLLGALLCFMLLNIAAGTGSANLQQMFDKETFLNGIKKVLYILFCCVMMCAAGLCLPNLEIAIVDGVTTNVFEAMRLILLAANATYGFKAAGNFKNLFGVSSSVEVATPFESLPKATELIVEEDIDDVEVESVG